MIRKDFLKKISLIISSRYTSIFLILLFILMSTLIIFFPEKSQLFIYLSLIPSILALGIELFIFANIRNDYEIISAKSKWLIQDHNCNTGSCSRKFEIIFHRRIDFLEFFIGEDENIYDDKVIHIKKDNFGNKIINDGLCMVVYPVNKTIELDTPTIVPFVTERAAISDCRMYIDNCFLDEIGFYHLDVNFTFPKRNNYRIRANVKEKSINSKLRKKFVEHSSDFKTLTSQAIIWEKAQLKQKKIYRLVWDFIKK